MIDYILNGASNVASIDIESVQRCTVQIIFSPAKGIDLLKIEDD